MLAGLPGVRLAGWMRDPLGRAGYGIALPPPSAAAAARGGGPGGSDEEILVIDPATGSLLADEYVATRSAPGAIASAAAFTAAVPGPASCPPPKLAKPEAGSGHVAVTVTPALLKRLSCVPGAPVLALRAGQADWHDAVVTAGWTDTSPQLPPPAQQFSPADTKGDEQAARRGPVPVGCDMAAASPTVHR